MAGQGGAGHGARSGRALPQRVIDRLAADPPRDLAGLEQVEGVRRWRTKLFGGDLLNVLASA